MYVCDICILQVCDFLFDFTGNYNEEIVLSLRSDSGLLKRGEAEKLRGLSKLKYMYFALWYSS